MVDGIICSDLSKSREKIPFSYNTLTHAIACTESENYPPDVLFSDTSMIYRMKKPEWTYQPFYHGQIPFFLRTSIFSSVKR